MFYYLDDFLIVAPPQPDECQRDLWKLLQLFNKLGIPVAEGAINPVDVFGHRIRYQGDGSLSPKKESI